MENHIWIILVAFWQQWYGKLTALISIGGIGAALRWGAEFREKWHAGSVAREQLDQLKKQAQEKKRNEEDEDRIPQVMEMLDSLVSDERKAKNLWAGFVIPGVEWFVEKLPEHEVRLVKKAYKEWKGTRNIHYPALSKWR
jgi:hypothetical protein